MAQPKTSRFTAWILSPEEEKAGSILSELNIKKLQNLQAIAAEQSIGLKVNPELVTEFIQAQAYLSGQIELISYLLDSHESVSVSITTDSLG